jgi:UV DNA damage endonuclease
VLENDESSYSAAEILNVCRLCRVPMVFDAHHQLVKERLADYDDPSVAEMTDAAAQTWPDPAWALVHISNGLSHLHDRRHSDYITHMPRAFRRSPWIEVEAKAKEQAIEQLRQHWLKRGRSATRSS